MIVNQPQELILLLLLERQQLIEQLNRRRRPNKAENINIHKRSHDHLAVKPIHEPTMARNRVAKIFNLKRSLETTRKKSSKRPDRRRKQRQSQRVYLKRVQIHLRENKRENLGQIVRLKLENARRLTIVRVYAFARVVVLERAHEILVLAQDRAQNEPKQNGRERAANKTLPGLFGRELDEPRLAEEKAKHVRHDIVADDQRNGQQKPNQTLEHILDHQIRLSHN